MFTFFAETFALISLLKFVYGLESFENFWSEFFCEILRMLILLRFFRAGGTYFLRLLKKLADS
jgi:hypothetical protein